MAKTPTGAKPRTPAKPRAKPAATKTDAERRETLRGRIAAGERRNSQRSFADQARAAADGALDYVKANPLKAMAAVTAGALLIGAMTRPGRRAGRKAGARAGALAGIAAEAALAYGLGLLDAASGAAGKGQDKLADLGESVGETARAWQSTAAREGSALSDYLVDAAKRGGKRTGRTIDELRSRLRH